MAVCNIPEVNGTTGFKVLVHNSCWLAEIRSSVVEEYNTIDDTINRYHQLLSAGGKPFLVVPDNSLEQLQVAGVLDKQPADRIVVYYETEADIQCAIQNSFQGINSKIQKRYLAQNLPSVLDGMEIASILYKGGPVDSRALNSNVVRMQKRIERKRRFTKSVSTNTSPISNISQQCRQCGQLSYDSTSCRFYQAAARYEHHETNSTISINDAFEDESSFTPLSKSPNGDKTIDELIFK